LLSRGAQSLSDAELLSVLLRTKNGRARDLLEELGGLQQLVGLDSHALRGNTKTRTAAMLALVELACRIARAKIPDKVLLRRVDTVARYLRMRYDCPDQEVMGALYLDIRHRLLRETEIFRGTLSRAAVEPRAILREALTCSAARIILFHTHPSGDPAPSAEDIGFTARLAEASDLVGIRLEDHIILGANNSWVSLKRTGAF
jgi:DNA repair protein RadC